MLSRLLRYGLSRFQAFRAADSGNVAIMFSVSLVALIGVGGAAVDYIRLVDQRTVYNAAADSAALAAVSAAREAERNGMSDIPKIAQRAAVVAWNTNVATAATQANKPPTIVIKKTGKAWSAKVSYDAATPTTFMGILGVRNMKLAGEATASTTVEKVTTYWDFHIAIDTSSSMGIGATQADMDALKAHPSINCMFACHWADYTKGEEDSVTWAKKAGIKLRVDIVDEAVDVMIDDMKTASTADNVRAKLWSLNDTAVNLVEMTKKLADIKNHKIELYKTPVSVGNTNYRAALEKLEAEVGKAGGGKSSVDPKKALFLVTDGIHDAPVKEPNFVIDWPDHYIGPMDPAFCQKLKDNGVTVGVLYIDYIVPAGFEFAADPYKADVLPRLKACASDGLFFNATSPDGIKSAMKDMLATTMGLGAVRLTE